jgi:sec-independent protein translocase protein TatC
MAWLSNFLKSRSDKGEMPFIEHLEELRWRIIKAFLAIFAAGIIYFLNKSFIFDTLILGPVKPNFPTYKLFCWVGNVFHQSNMCIHKVNFTFYYLELAAPFLTHVKMAFVLGLITVFPYIIFQLWQFIKPALHDKERETIGGVVLSASLLFYLGVGFGYFLMAPLSINFLGSYQVSSAVRNQFNFNSYTSLLITMVLAAGLVFELPLIIFFIAKMGLITSQFMTHYRRHAVIAVLVLATIITPSPDVFSLFIVALPIYILYEVSIIMVKRGEKRDKLKKA